MKRISQFLVILVVLLGISKASFAQFERINLILGLNSSSIASDAITPENLGNVIGVNAGATYDYPISAVTSIKAGILYSGRGYRQQFVDANSKKYEMNATFQYVDVPLYLNFTFIPEFKFFFGPQLSVLLASEQTIRRAHHRETDTSSDGLSMLNVSIGGGIDIGPEKGVFLRMGIERGLLSVLENVSDGAFGNTAKLSMGYRF